MDKIEELLTRGVEKIYPSKEALAKILRSGKKLRVYQGFDPTGPKLHLGHMVGLRKLRQWQELGHEVIFLIGNFTGMIGDPTGKDKTRQPLTHEEVLRNAKNYKIQAGRILKFEGGNPAIIKFNNDWWGRKMKAKDLLELAYFVSYQQLIEREMFQERIKKGKEIALVELLYPLMQGYDSVVMDVDLEIGGSDQLFNMMIGRDLMQKIKGKEKFVMTTPLLTDTLGNKIGKTEGNVIALDAPPNEFYGMIMSLGDEIIVKGFEYLTDIPLKEVRQIEKAIARGENPMVYKKKLAYTLTAILNGEDAAQRAQDEFERVFQKKQTPLSLLEYNFQEGMWNVVDLLLKTKLASSKSEAKRLITQGGVKIDNIKWQWIDKKCQIRDGSIIKVGKRKFLKISTGGNQ